MGQYRIDNMKGFIGKEIHLSPWLTVTQEMVTGFATATLDHDWMHVDVPRSRRESPFGETIVQGFLMQSLIIHFTHEGHAEPEDIAYGLNYGMDRVRFLLPVKTGSRLRDRIVLTGFDERAPGRYLQRTTHTIEVEGETKPAVVADWLVLWFKTLQS